jgi:microcystin-dependent protein
MMTISNPSLTQISQALAEMLPKLKPLSVPTGMISAFHTVPEGWLQCNGAAVSRTTYAALFAVIGTKYGSGDGSNTFNLPNLHHKFIEGTNTTSEVGQSVSAGLPNITGKVMVGGYQLMTSKHTGAFFGSDYGTADYHGQDGRQNVPTTFGIDASRSSAVYGAASTVQPASTRLLYCIKS